MPMLMLVIAADNISGGLASAAFVAFLSSLTNISFTAMQYSIFSSLMTLFPKLLGGYSGGIVDALGYGQFFILTTLIGVPVMILVWYSGRLLQHSGETAQEK
jgi:PAT family beta-lactamase induction signal transducer AmpG